MLINFIEQSYSLIKLNISWIMKDGSKIKYKVMNLIEEFNGVNGTDLS